jgi:hypothetical protein
MNDDRPSQSEVALQEVLAQFAKTLGDSNEGGRRKRRADPPGPRQKMPKVLGRMHGFTVMLRSKSAASPLPELRNGVIYIGTDLMAPDLEVVAGWLVSNALREQTSREVLKAAAKLRKMSMMAALEHSAKELELQQVS